jgi:hypothetical protein
MGTPLTITWLCQPVWDINDNIRMGKTFTITFTKPIRVTITFTKNMGYDNIHETWVTITFTSTFTITFTKKNIYDNIHEKKHLRSIGFTKKNIYDQ